MTKSETSPSRRPTLSLKGRALKYLATREHSRLELTRKLGPHAESPEQLTQLLDELEGKGWLSAERFAQSVLHRKASRYGAARLQAELAQHQLPADIAREAAQSLRETEFARAHALWLKRFGAPPTTPEDQARQMRFLAGRGFAGDVVRRVIRGEGLDRAE
ncbi:MAG TPA: recombination regulator RecX [Aquabacterium sp.]|nr:recombination regulator RecX [Aquabacterium sp.]